MIQSFMQFHSFWGMAELYRLRSDRADCLLPADAARRAWDLPLPDQFHLLISVQSCFLKEMPRGSGPVTWTPIRPRPRSGRPARSQSQSLTLGATEATQQVADRRAALPFVEIIRCKSQVPGGPACTLIRKTQGGEHSARQEFM